MRPWTAEQPDHESGFTLIELLVVVLIIGILAAIAIPSFLSQKDKATDASAKEVARTALLAVETYQTDHITYTGVEPKLLHEYEPSLQVEPGGNNSYLSAAEAIEGGKGFTVTATAEPNGDTFTMTKNGLGEISRTCEAKGANTAGCKEGTW